MIAAKNISFSANGKDILRDVSIKVESGKLTAIIGPNGSGKTSLMNCLSGNIVPDKGTIEYENRKIQDCSASELSGLRSVISQHYPADIPFTPRKIISIPMEIVGRNDNKSFDKVTEMLGVGDYLDRSYSKLSGGEKQRVQIARGLMQYYLSGRKDYILFLDEPGSGLDIGAATAFGSMMRSLLVEGLGVLWVLHDINMALDIADRIIIMKDGGATLIEDVSELYDGRLLAQTYGVELEKYSSGTGDNKFHPKMR